MTRNDEELCPDCILLGAADVCTCKKKKSVILYARTVWIKNKLFWVCKVKIFLMWTSKEYAVWRGCSKKTKRNTDWIIGLWYTFFFCRKLEHPQGKNIQTPHREAGATRDLNPGTFLLWGANHHATVPHFCSFLFYNRADIPLDMKVLWTNTMTLHDCQFGWSSV